MERVQQGLLTSKALCIQRGNGTDGLRAQSGPQRKLGDKRSSLCSGFFLSLFLCWDWWLEWPRSWHQTVYRHALFWDGGCGLGRICYNHFQQMLIECAHRTPRNRKVPLCWKLGSHLGTLDTLKVHRWNWIYLPKEKAQSSTFAKVGAELPRSGV